MNRKESSDERIKVLAAVAIVNRGKVLLIKEQEEPYQGEWVVPQGYVKRDETVSEAARREVREELGVEVDLEGLVGVYDATSMVGSERVHYVIVCYLGRIRTGEPRPTVEAIDSAWVDVRNRFQGVAAPVQRLLVDLSQSNRREHKYGRDRPRRYEVGR